MEFDVVPETLAKTTLGALQNGDSVNLERAMAATGRFDGHIVQGHTEGVAEVVSFSRNGEDIRLTITLPPALGAFVVPKGSVAIDGVSLTVAQREGDQCTLALVPYTLEHTTLGSKKPGDRVNVETDMLIRGVQWIASSHAH
jgi:riboflavin synthase alpha subunit